MILNGHDYTLTVAPGADWALMAAIALCFNDCLNEPRPTGGGRWRRKSKEADAWGSDGEGAGAGAEGAEQGQSSHSTGPQS